MINKEPQVRTGSYREISSDLGLSDKEVFRLFENKQSSWTLNGEQLLAFDLDRFVNEVACAPSYLNEVRHHLRLAHRWFIL